MSDPLRLRRAEATEPGVRALIAAQLAHGAEAAPETNDYTYGVAALSAPQVTIWALADSDTVAAIGALCDLGDGMAEVKSVHVAAAYRGQGLARRLMQHLHEAARAAGHRALVLETGSEALPGYDAARALYRGLGYGPCGVLPGYRDDPASAFFRLELA
ncbi:GNAT family N-acetyltransferase [uncultured Jannaschia sp.]|uniref:GNAT family N-acetyltransferase n=1 Tax=uncultured Jannaschia sp. TaxID=293347 RepID=UPI0026051BCA|nr:GNAT family N-acetyltransferase [uncultured Jannaschia sp.]